MSIEPKSTNSVYMYINMELFLDHFLVFILILHRWEIHKRQNRIRCLLYYKRNIKYSHKLCLPCTKSESVLRETT